MRDPDHLLAQHLRNRTWLQSIPFSGVDERFDELTNAYVLNLLESGRYFDLDWKSRLRRWFDRLRGNPYSRLPEFLRYVCYQTTGVWGVPIVLASFPHFQAETRSLGVDGAVIVINARFCRVLFMMVDLTQRCLMEGHPFWMPRPAAQLFLSCLSLFAAGFSDCAGIPDGWCFDRATVALMVSPVVRQLLVFVALHEHGHIQLGHLASGVRARTVAEMRRMELDADAFALSTLRRHVRTEGLPEIGLAIHVGLLFAILELIERTVRFHEVALAVTASERFEALVSMLPAECQLQSRWLFEQVVNLSVY